MPKRKVIKVKGKGDDVKDIKPNPFTHNMTVEYPSFEDVAKQLSKRLEKPKVGVSQKPKYETVGKKSVNPNLVTYHNSLTKQQLRDIKASKKATNEIGSNAWINNKLGSASKAENTLVKTTDSKVLGLIFNPLDDETFQRIEDAFINDGELQQNIYKYWGLVLGNEFKLQLADVKTTYPDDDTKNNEYQKIINHKPYIIARDKAQRIIRKTKFKNVWETITNLGSIYGRGAAEIIRDDETNDPVFFNVLYSQLLGDPVLNKYHQMIGVEYEDLPDDNKFKNLPGSINDEHKAAFPRHKIIYYAHNDTPVTIGAKYFGISTLESCIDSSEAKRIILQKEIKEWVSKSHTGNIILTTDEPIPQEECDAIATNVSQNPGNVLCLNYKMTAQSVPIPNNVEQLPVLMDALNREMLRYLDIISPLGGYEHVQNFASLAKTIVVWLASTLNPQRLKQKQIIKEQFLDDVFQTCLLQQNQLVLEDPQTYELKLYNVSYPGQKPIEFDDNVISKDVAKEQKIVKDIKKQELDDMKASANQEQEQEDNIIKQDQDPEALTVKQAFERIKKAIEKNPDFNLIEGFKFTETGIPAAELNIEIDLPNFNDFAEQADKILSWVRERMMTKRKGLSMVGMEDQIDDIKQLDAEAERKREEMMSQGVMFDESGKAIPNFRNANTQDEILDKDPKARTKRETESLNKKLADKNDRDKLNGQTRTREVLER